MEPSPQKAHPCLTWLLAAGVAGLCLFHLGAAMAGYPLYRDQHLGTALIYAKEGVDLMRPVIVGFNAGGTPTVLELPLWQAVAGWLLRWGGGAWVWGNIASLLLFLPALWPMYRLARAHLGERAAGWATLALLFQPIVFVLAGRAGTDGWSVALMIWFLWAADRLIATAAWRWVAVAAAAGTLLAVTKMPLFFAAGLAAAVYVALQHRGDFRRWLQLGLVGGGAAAIYLAWARYAAGWDEAAVYPASDLRFASSWRWYFGDWEYRSRLGNYARGGWRMAVGLFGSFALGSVAVLALGRRGLRWAWAIGVGAGVASLVFLRLVLEHKHYYVMFSPAAALLVGAAIARVEGWMALRSAAARAAVAAVIFGGLGASLVQGLLASEIVEEFDPYPARVTGLIRRWTEESDRLLVSGGGGGGDQFLRAARRGLTLHENRGILRDPAAVADLRRRGFTKVVLIAESPLQVALQKTNPGGAGRERRGTADVEADIDPAWPTVYRDADVVIRAVPPPGAGE